jgi:hypothetical protein
MKQSWFRTLMKIWISLVSLIAFLFGWILFGHSAKPATASASSGSNGGNNNDPSLQLTPLPTLAPLPPVGSSNNGSGVQQVQPLQQPSFNFSFPAPSFRTRGS